MRSGARSLLVVGCLLLGWLVAVPAQAETVQDWTSAPTPVLTGLTDGGAAVGQTIGVSFPGWSPAVDTSDPSSVRYGWHRQPSGAYEYASVNPRYTTTPADGGTAMYVDVEVFKTGYPAQSFTLWFHVDGLPWGALGTGLPHTTSPGSVLQAPSIADLPQGATVGYQWLRNEQPVLGATSSTYPVTWADLDATIRLQLVATAPHHDPLRWSGFTEVRAPRWLLDSRPKITGRARVGHRLTAHLTAALPAGFSISYQWCRGTKRIKGAVGPRYRLRQQDAAHDVSVFVRESYGTWQASSRVSKELTVRR